MSFLIIGAACVLAIYMAWNIGANDVANSMSTAVGTKAITLRQALLIAAILNVVGAVFVGSHVVETLRKGIVNPQPIASYKIMYGALSSLLAAGLWITFATWRGLPVSTTHSIVGALTGFGLVAGGTSVINWGKLGQVVLSWIISPLFAGLLAFCVFQLIRFAILNKTNPIRYAQIAAPFITGITFFIFTLSIFWKTPLGTRIGNASLSFIIAFSVAVIAAVGGYLVMHRIARWQHDVEEFFRRLQILTSCYVAFSHGANDVANAISPFATVVTIAQTGTIGAKTHVPLYFLAIGGIGIAIGIITWGWRVIQTVAFKITRLTNSRAFCIDFSAASAVLLASKLGMPVSTTHAAVGAVIGIGLARGIEAIDLRVIRDIAVSWGITLPISAGLSAIFFKLFIH